MRHNVETGEAAREPSVSICAESWTVGHWWVGHGYSPAQIAGSLQAVTAPHPRLDNGVRHIRLVGHVSHRYHPLRHTFATRIPTRTAFLVLGQR